MSEEVIEVPPYRLIYFDIRGLAEPIRWMFVLADIPFIDERISLAEWNRIKHRFSDHVGQLPILIFENEVLTQVHTVMRFVARRLGFSGLTDMQEARADEAADLVYDLRLCAANYRDCFNTKTPDIVRHTVFRDFHNEPSKAKKERMMKDLPEKDMAKYLSKFEEMIQESEGDYIAGPVLTYADLTVVNFLDVVTDMIGPQVLENYTGLQQLKDNVLGMPAIKQWCENRALAQDVGGG